MPDPEAIKIFASYGLAGVLCLILVYALIRILMQQLKDNRDHQKEMMEANAIREDRLAKIIELQENGTKLALIEHDKRVVQSINRMEEASRYQRQEHRKIIELQEQCLTRHDGAVLVLKEISLTLANNGKIKNA